MLFQLAIPLSANCNRNICRNELEEGLLVDKFPFPIDDCQFLREKKKKINPLMVALKATLPQNKSRDVPHKN